MREPSRLPTLSRRRPDRGPRLAAGVVGPCPGPLTLVLDTAATYRLTRLVTQDTITEPVRDAIEDRADDELHPWWAKLSTLVQCPWCASVWIAGGVVVARRVAPRWWAPVAEGLAMSGVAAIVQVFATSDTD